jgi:hypothetical protein
MAEMIPDRLPANASAGEGRVFAALQRLDDDCIVYYEPIVRARHPDFLVLIPDLGLLVIEVKGWWPNSVHRANMNEVTVLERGREQIYPHPVRQARDYMNRLRDECRENPCALQLMNCVGHHAGRFIFPFGHVAVLSNITRAQLNEAERNGLANLFTADRTITRDELDIWATLDGVRLKTELARRFDPTWNFPRLTPTQIDVLRSIIHPEVRIAARQHEFKYHPTQDLDLKVLDLRQERHARSIGDGHRVVYGLAGSGKTVILIARAKLLAEDREKRILVLCFNKVFAKYLATCLASHPNVEVRHFHGWGTHNGVRFREDEEFEDYGARFLQRMERGDGEAGRYDAVLIDEAQDFACPWFHCAKLALKEPDDGDLMVVGDGSQTVYRKRSFNWADAGIHAQGRTISRKFDLDKNYRNTTQILTAAQPFAGEATPDSSDAAIRSFNVQPAAAWPIVIRKPDRGSETKAAVELVRGSARGVS